LPINCSNYRIRIDKSCLRITNNFKNSSELLPDKSWWKRSTSSILLSIESSLLWTPCLQRILKLLELTAVSNLKLTKFWKKNLKFERNENTKGSLFKVKSNLLWMNFQRDWMSFKKDFKKTDSTSKIFKKNLVLQKRFLLVLLPRINEKPKILSYLHSPLSIQQKDRWFALKNQNFEFFQKSQKKIWKLYLLNEEEYFKISNEG